VQAPWLEFADANDTPCGNVSVSSTPVAAEGPELTTVIV